MYDWLAIMKNECDRTSQRQVAERIGYSAPTVNAVLKGSYKGDLKAIEQAVRGVYMAETVICPVQGEISSDVCLKQQRSGFSTANPWTVKLARACPICSHAKGGKHAQ